MSKASDEPGPSETRDVRAKQAAAPEPDAPHKPESPTDLTKPSWKYVVKRTWREFTKDQCTDLAAALTYYGLLSAFPAAIAMLSLVGLVGDGPETVKTMLDVLRQIGASGVADTMGPTLEKLASAPQAAGFAFVIGLATALWSASGYVGAFGRALNRMYDVVEGRPFYKLRPLLLLITFVALMLAGTVALALALTGPAAQAVGDAIGLGSTGQTIWDIVKWPVILAVVVVIVALLYYWTPNVRQPKFRWISVGAVVAIVIWILASVLFGFYVANFGSYNKTYGTLAGVVVALLWLWITNLALLFGAELDSELERGRQLQAGIEAEREIQLPMKDTRNVEKALKKEKKDIQQGRELREQAGEPDDSDAESGSNSDSDVSRPSESSPRRG